MNMLKRRIAILALALLCLLPGGITHAATRGPAQVSAAAPGPGTNGMGTVIRYTGCALGIAASKDEFSLYGALLYCALLLHDSIH